MWDKRAFITDVHDGDTLTVTLDQGFGDLKEQINIRLLGVWAPELTEAGGKEARQFALDWTTKYTLKAIRFPFIVTTARTKLDVHEITSFTRYVGTIETIDHSHNLNTDLIEYLGMASTKPLGVKI